MFYLCSLDYSSCLQVIEMGNVTRNCSCKYGSPQRPNCYSKNNIGGGIYTHRTCWPSGAMNGYHCKQAVNVDAGPDSNPPKVN